jgi:hypothetical protein
MSMLNSVECEQLAHRLVYEYGDDLLFADRSNRDAVWQIVKMKGGGNYRRSSIKNQLLDPRYTVEGRHLPDKGLGNSKQWYGVLYRIERKARWS